MYAKIHPTIAVQCHPSHEADGGIFISIQQAKKQRNRHRIRSMRAAKTISSAGVATHQMQRIEGGFMGRSKPTNPRFEDAAAEEITQAYGNTETDQHQEHKFPASVFAIKQNDQDHIEPRPGLGSTRRPHHLIEPSGIMTVDPK